VSWIDHDVSAPVLEVRAPDGLGVLHRIAAAVTASGGIVLSARCQTLGADVVDSFSIQPLDPAARRAVGAAVLAALT
jgi:[protein-PII] uridylyltransferase